MTFLKQFIQIFFGGIWSLFSIDWPGFNFPIGYAFLGVAFAVVALRLFTGLFSVNVGSTVSRVFNNESKLISKVTKERKDDIL